MPAERFASLARCSSSIGAPAGTSSAASRAQSSRLMTHECSERALASMGSKRHPAAVEAHAEPASEVKPPTIAP